MFVTRFERWLVAVGVVACCHVLMFVTDKPAEFRGPGGGDFSGCAPIKTPYFRDQICEQS